MNDSCGNQPDEQADAPATKDGATDEVDDEDLDDTDVPPLLPPGVDDSSDDESVDDPGGEQEVTT